MNVCSAFYLSQIIISRSYMGQKFRILRDHDWRVLELSCCRNSGKIFCRSILCDIYISRCNLTQKHRITINNSRCHHASFTEGKQFWTNLSSVNEEIYDSITASDDTFHQNMSRTIFSLAQSNTSNATIQHQIWNINIARF